MLTCDIGITRTLRTLSVSKIYKASCLTPSVPRIGQNLSISLSLSLYIYIIVHNSAKVILNNHIVLPY